MNTQGIEQSNIQIKELPLNSFNTSKIVNKNETIVEKDEFESHEDLNIGQYNAKGNVEPPIATKFNLILAIKNQIDDQVKEITQYYMSILEESKEGKQAKESLKNYFEENPEDLKKIEQGEIPDYWNQENTAKRIFDIALLGYKDGMDKKEFFHKSSKIVEQAYSEVEKIVGKLPDLVNNTKDAVLKGLQEFSDGKKISEIIFS